MIVYVSPNPDRDDLFSPVEVPDLEIARSIARGLIASPEVFCIRACGWVGCRGSYGGPVDWFRDLDLWD